MAAADHHHGAPAHWADVVAPTDRRVGPLLAWCASLGVAVALLLVVDGGVATPALSDVPGWRAWLADRPVEQSAFVLGRLGALAVAWYLVGVTAVSVLARLADAARLVRVADLLAVGPVRTLVQQALGTGLALGVLAVAVPTTTPAPVVHDVAAAGDAMTPEGARLAPPIPAAPAVDPAPAPTPEPEPAPEPASVVPAPPTSEPAAAADAAVEHTVVAGDHLWSLAEQAVSASLDRDPTDAEVHRHWEAVVDANRARLVDPDNPDLLLPGQLVVLPAVAS